MRLAWAVAAVTLVLVVLIVPPLVNVSRYKGRITQVLSASLGRPVRLSSVELHLLPRPGFVLTDLTVEEDPAYGAEPVLHANTVAASIRLASLWRGLEISRISVDEASLNLVRTGVGHWNVESLFRSASQSGPPGSGRRPRRQVRLPYLEATNSRINVKNGAEKLPFSLINADVSFWQEDPGEWRVRLRGQPARTDLSLNLADTGVVRLEADLHRAPELRQIPMHIDLEWSEAQLGQLTRLLIGSDPGWRGDLRGELHLDGTPDNARIQTRLRAAGVHRAEFAPAEPMDFDATCALVYHYANRAVDGLECNSPLGEGRVHLTGTMAGDGAAPRLTVELDRLPVAAALDALRTIRRGVAPGLEATGTISGKIAYAETAPAVVPASSPKVHSGKPHGPPPGPFTGSLTVQGFELTGEGLNQPIRLARVVLEPAGESALQPQQLGGLTATAAIPAGAASPMTVNASLSFSGYALSVRGQASLARLRELAQVAGLTDKVGLGAVTGDAAVLDLKVEGPWLAPESLPVEPESRSSAAEAGPDQLMGTVALRNARWKPEFLANPLEVAQATLHLDGNTGQWDPVIFAYGPVDGTASLTVPFRCDAPQPCLPQFEVNFETLDAAALEAAILGARERNTLLSELIARLSPSRTPAWPQLEGTVKADSLLLGPVTLNHPSAALSIRSDGADFSAFDAGLFGGQIHAVGKIRAPAAGGSLDRPTYSFDGQFEHLNPAGVGRLIGQRWTGGEIQGSGNVDLAGYTDTDFAESASGTLHFDWRRGSVSAANGRGSPAARAADTAPQALAHFDRWTADAAIAGGAVTLQKNEVRRGARRASVTAHVTFGAPPGTDFASARPADTAHK